MGYMKFSVVCKECGHSNRPDRNTRNGIKKTLTGEFSTCRGCGKQWDMVHVPLRPLVTEIVDHMTNMGQMFSSRVRAFRYKGKVPKAVGA